MMRYDMIMFARMNIVERHAHLPASKFMMVSKYDRYCTCVSDVYRIR